MLFQRPWLGSIGQCFLSQRASCARLRYEVAWSIGGGRSQEFAAGHANASERSPPLASRCLAGWASWVWILAKHSKFVGTKMKQSLKDLGNVIRVCVCVVQPFNDPRPLRLHLVPGRFWTSFAKLLPQSRAPCTRGRFCCCPLWWMDRPEAMIFKKSRTGFWTAAKHVDFKFSSFEHRESCVRAGTHWHSQSYPEQIVGSCL